MVNDSFANYISTFAALCELINNSIQADAKNIWLDIDYTPEEELCPLIIKKIVIKDDGRGVHIDDLCNKILDIGTGSGADIIKKGWNDNQWPTPELTERTQPDETTMTLKLRVDTGGKERMHNVGEIVGETVLSILSNRQNLIVDFLRKSPSASAKTMSESLSVSPRTIERDLQKLTAMGVVAHRGIDFGGEWIILI